MANPKNHHFHALAFWKDSDNPEPFFHDCFATRKEANEIIIFWRDLWGDSLTYYVEHNDESGRLVSSRMMRKGGAKHAHH